MPMIHLKQFVLNKQAEWGRSLDIKEIAEGAGISRDTVSRLMQDNPPVRLDETTVNKLCKFFGVKPGAPVPFVIYDPRPEKVKQ